MLYCRGQWVRFFTEVKYNFLLHSVQTGSGDGKGDSHTLLQLVPGALSPGIKRLGSQDNHSIPYTAKSKHVCDIPPPQPHDFVDRTTLPLTSFHGTITHCFIKKKTLNHVHVYFCSFYSCTMCKQFVGHCMELINLQRLSVSR